MYLSDKHHNSHDSATTPSIPPLKYGKRGLVPEKEPAAAVLVLTVVGLER